MVTTPPTRRFGIGADATARLGMRVVGPVSVQLSLGNWWFRNRDPNNEGGRPGRIISFEGGVRVAHVFPGRLVGGPFLDANAGLALTGGLRRFTFDVGAGWEFAVHPAVALGLFGRFGQVVQPDGEPVPQDARFIAGGLALTARIPPPPPPPPVRIPDEDRDGIPDAVDHCPQQPEDFDHFEDSDGCRDSDNDEDGLLDARDQCPFEPESRNRYQDEDGCPDDAPVAVAEVRNDRIEISQRIRFEYGTDRLMPASFPILMEVVHVLLAHPEIASVRIEGHADDRGQAEFNQRLSERRAIAVVSFLREHGVVNTVLEPVGFGSSRPLCRQNTERCYSVNRRVEFVITSVMRAPVPSSATTPPPSTPSPAPTTSRP
jgi:OOP family OmpA-OmpF porin